MNQYGTHVMQKFVEMKSLDEEETLYKDMIADNVVMMSKDPCATHVIQAMITLFRDPSFLEFLELHFVDRTNELATHKYGVVVLKM